MFQLVNHLFEAIDTWGWTLGYYSVTKSKAAGVNYVYLYTSEDLF